MRNANAEWQQDYFGRHVQLVPAENAWGYQYRPWGDPQMVTRAIPAEGMVTDRPRWAGAPQAAYWMGGKVTRYRPDIIQFLLRKIRKK